MPRHGLASVAAPKVLFKNWILTENSMLLHGLGSVTAPGESEKLVECSMPRHEPLDVAAWDE